MQVGSLLCFVTFGRHACNLFYCLMIDSFWFWLAFFALIKRFTESMVQCLIFYLTCVFVYVFSRWDISVHVGAEGEH